MQNRVATTNKAYGDQLRSIGIHRSALSTTLPKEGRDDIREWITKASFSAEDTQEHGALSYRSILVYPERDANPTHTRKIFNLTAKEIYGQLGSARGSLEVISLLDYLKKLQTNEYRADVGWEGLPPKMLFIADAVEDIPCPVNPELMLEARNNIRHLQGHGHGVALMSLSSSMKRIEEWWTSALISEVLNQGDVFKA